MSPVARILSFLAVCAAVFGVALGVGRLVGPVASEPAGMAGHGEDQEMGGLPHRDVGGLEAAADGYTLRLTEDRLEPGRRSLAFTVSGPDGHPVTAYDEQHRRDLHLIVVRRDLTGFQHVHPTLDAGTGEWSTDVELSPGAWRVLADFRPTGGEPLVLGSDLLVPGGFAPEQLGEDRLDAHVDGYDVTLGGSITAGGETVLTATVQRDGRPVTDLQRYLGSYGHLVSLRAGDLGYLHVHPDEDAGPGPAVSFHTEFPTPGRYRLFLDFRHGGAVHTAAFTVTVDGSAGAGEGGSHDH